MIPAFVAVVPALSPAVGEALISAGASQVLTWSEFAAGRPPAGAGAGDRPVVLLPEAAALPLAELHAALAHLLGVAPGEDTVVATVSPVTDTLKQVDAAGTVRGTADRDEHRAVRAPVAVRLPLLLAVADDVDPGSADGSGKDGTPDVAELLLALVERGATVRAAPAA